MSTIVGIDVGGTFTDFVLWRNGFPIIYKVLSTHPNPEIGVIQGLKELGIIENPSPKKLALNDLNNVEEETKTEIIHGSTIATNALLERKGARVGLITTGGFTDIIDIGRQNRPHLYRFWSETPVPLVLADCRFGIKERIAADGTVLAEPEMRDIEDAVDKMQEKGIEAVAVCLLFSFLNPAHETVIEQVLHARGFYVSVSNKILPEYREYERMTTTVVNAYVTPLVSRYINRLGSILGAAGKRLKIMQSNGGLLSASATAQRAVQTVLSGPAGGVVAALESARLAGFERVISFDMGGTSTDVSLIDGAVRFTTEFDLEGLPIKTPMVDIYTVGAGGGSIAHIDEGGALQVGPDSAGSDPGPACYGKGEKPTITDANVLLGRLQAGRFLGGRQTLDIKRAEDSVASLKKGTNLDSMALANGIIRIAVSNMQKAVRKISIERGFDPRDFAIVAFGGAGPMHACELAEASLVSTVIIPPTPGVFSALGMTMADVVKDYSKSILMGEEGFEENSLNGYFAPLMESAINDLESEGFSTGEIELQKMLDIRYAGQSFELTVSIEDQNGKSKKMSKTPKIAEIAELFHKAHAIRYGYADKSWKIEIVAVRLRATGLRNKPQKPGFSSRRDKSNNTEVEYLSANIPSTELSARVYFDEWLETKCFNRSEVQKGDMIAGPALVFQLDTTIVIPPGWLGAADKFDNLILSRTHGRVNGMSGERRVSGERHG